MCKDHSIPVEFTPCLKIVTFKITEDCMQFIFVVTLQNKSVSFVIVKIVEITRSRTAKIRQSGLENK